MISFLLYPNTDFNLYINSQKSGLDCKYHLLVGRYYWMKSTTQSCLLICGGHRYENPVRAFGSSVSFVNVLRIAPKNLQDYRNPYSLLIEDLDLGQWTSSLGYLFVQMVVMLFSPILVV